MGDLSDDFAAHIAEPTPGNGASLGCAGIPLPDYSQFGEQGRILELLDLIGVGDRQCCEFGTGETGLDCSNVAVLWKHMGWSVTLVEADADRYHRMLTETLFAHETWPGQLIDAKHRTLTPDNINDELPGPYDVCSVDVDGSDWLLVEAWETRPRLLLTEWNQTIPPWLDIRQMNPDDMFGCSAIGWGNLLTPRSYDLMGVTDCNLIWVHNPDQYNVDWEMSGWAWLQDEVERVWRRQATFLATDYTGRPRPLGAQPPWGLRWDDRCDTPLLGDIGDVQWP